ncbi:ABC transporter ATP-binding protein [Sporolactobacillus terrae]|uniref:ABC transporter ATP-binding protein n=1 Tax=Sporolactobacillus terrae TaxID=269673 RepID=A0ABX5Q9W5_9BACL|nr:ABC transporter ATP-binding protein [Sporolactobacillus terrae]QAA23463.1 ABC transporter ATP-binding protein [Sporolactobacillus terrae]QAA26433.1 ABC transporter ATP-binding protein [Sporolactobacillus terrae]UAK15527.1 ABC transporter ATP-binding protein [Sporolactobacillus terrae]
MPVIELSHISKRFGKFVAVNDVSFTVEKGEFFGFIGPNGAGKSTTMNMMLNFIKSSGGKIKLLGKNVPEHDLDVKKQIGYVPSDVRFYPQLRVRDLFRYTLDFHHMKGDSAELKRYCDLFQIDPQKKFGDLSLGNKKKVALVCALIHHPELIIMDEPTNGLDPLIHARLFRVLKEKQEQGVTIFLSSHNLKEVEDYCSRIAFIRSGKLIGVEDLTQVNQNVKVITVKADQLPIAVMEKIGATCVKKTDHEARFTYEGNMAQLFSTLSNLSPQLDDVTVANRDLEEQFMAMYERQEGERL